MCALLYLGFFIASVTTFGYQVVMSSGQAAVSLSMFLLFKSITTTALVVGLALDTDPVLCLAYFGCLGFNMRFVKDYTRNKRAELGGWPYPFFFNATRFTLFEAAKAVDFVWGVVGWSTLSVSFGAVYGNLEASLRFVITMIYVTLFLSDVWGSFVVYQVLRCAQCGLRVALNQRKPRAPKAPQQPEPTTTIGDEEPEHQQAAPRAVEPLPVVALAAAAAAAEANVPSEQQQQPVDSVAAANMVAPHTVL